MFINKNKGKERLRKLFNESREPSEILTSNDNDTHWSFYSFLKRDLKILYIDFYMDNTQDPILINNLKENIINNHYLYGGKHIRCILFVHENKVSSEI